MVLWAEHDGGYDADTWYWGALVMLAMLAVALIARGRTRPRLPRSAVVALVAFGAYVAWSYLSMTWAQTPGWALDGSDRALLYLLVFALFVVLPWTAETALVALVVYAVAIGVIALLLLLRLASGDHVAQLLDGGRLVAPTGYFNSTVALFMIGTLLATALAARRELPGLLRGTLVACASASLQLCVTGQSRGWLFTLPPVLVVSIAISRDRLRVAAVAMFPIVATLAHLHQLIRIFQSNSASDSAITHVATRAAHTSLLICAGTLVVGTLLAWGEMLTRGPSVSHTARRRVGAVVTTLAVALAGAGMVAATHGHPISFIKRQWHGFSHQATAVGVGSHFGAVGSGRYDFWRVTLDAVAAHPLGGLGQDNFADYYVIRRRTGEEPRWTHSLEMRLLAHTGIVGFALFAIFIGGALAGALRARRTGAPLARAVAGIAVLPLAVWLIHGSVDWFWEMPALSAPALGFLGMAIALAPSTADADANRPRRTPRALVWAAGAMGLVACTVVLAFPYLSVREVSQATDIGASNPAAALRDLTTAADLNPWNPDPGRVGGTIALQTGQYAEAERRFRQTIAREPGGWFAWLGAGLAASALGQSTSADIDFKTAASINARRPTIRAALAQVLGRHPLSAGSALKMLSSEQ
jgi:hypothetical protein